MSQEDNQLENLHQQASTHYLQGEYREALVAWRELLKLDPRDERAIEGVRLCRMLADEGGPGDRERPAETAGAPAATPSDGPAIGFGMGEDLDESLDRLDEVLETGPASDWMDAPAAPLEAAPPVPSQAPAPQSSAPEAAAAPEPLFDLSPPEEVEAPAEPSPLETFEFSEPEDMSIDSPPVDPAAAAAAAPTAAPPPAPPPAPAAGPTELDDLLGAALGGDEVHDRSPNQAAAEELQRRTNELMAEAMQHYERGERDEALSVLRRIAILDEGNEAAQAFAEHIRSEIEDQAGGATGAAGPAAEATPDTETTPGAEATASAEGTTADAPAEEPADPRLNHAPLDLDGESTEGLDLGAPALTEPDAADAAGAADAAEAAEGAMFPAAQAPAPGKRFKAKLEADKSKQLPTKWLILAGAFLLAATGGYLVTQMIGGDGGSVPDPVVAPPAAGGPAVPPGQPVASDPAPQAPVADPELVLEESLAQAREAFAAGDYSQAIMAYNQVILAAPENAEAAMRLQQAGELYRDQQAALEQRAEAIEAYNSGDFRSALRLFYRMQPENAEEEQKLQQYIRNGWYNLGVRALHSGDCRGAKDHLGEAKQIDAQDKYVAHAFRLARQCSSSGQDRAFYDAARRLPLRALEN